MARIKAALAALAFTAASAALVPAYAGAGMTHDYSAERAQGAAASLNNVGNRTSVSQGGARNGSAVVQNGRDNGAAITQRGDDNVAISRQNGNRNQLGVYQLGNANGAAVTQNNDDNALCLVQVGNNRNANITQNGGERQTVVQTDRFQSNVSTDSLRHRFGGGAALGSACTGR
jgi:hypothetical protein